MAAVGTASSCSWLTEAMNSKNSMTMSRIVSRRRVWPAAKAGHGWTGHMNSSIWPSYHGTGMFGPRQPSTTHSSAL
mgnify:CR=1 FL=1